MKNTRNLVVAASGYSTRVETFEGREHLVVPVVALVEGVMFAINAPSPELVTAEEFSRAPGGWNGRPIFEGHPLVNGKPVSGNLPEVLEGQRVGIVFNAGIKKNKLVMEAWLDVAACEERAPALLARARAGEDIEISVGVFVDRDESTGTFAGKQYKGAWKDIVPDHLALLVEGDEGACSRKAGCGVRAAAKGDIVKKDEKRSLLARLMGAFRGAQPADRMSNRDLEDELREELKAVEPTLDWVVAYLPALNPNRVVYQIYVPGTMPDYVAGFAMFQRAFSVDANGEVTIDANRVEVEPVISYEPVLMGEDELEDDDSLETAVGKRNNKTDQKMIQGMHDHSVALGAYCAPTAATAKPGGDSGAPAVIVSPEPVNKETENMEVKDIVAFLGSATECDKNALRTALGVETPKPAEAKTPTFEEVLATADPAIRAVIGEGIRVAGEKKAATIKVLKESGRCKFSDEQLGAMDQASLDNLATLAQVKTVDFSAQAPRIAESQESVPEPADLLAAMRAARGKK